MTPRHGTRANTHGHPRKNCFPRRTALEILEEHRRSSRITVFANGVFDLLHIRTRPLSASRAAEGDFLVVGMEFSDSSTQTRGRMAAPFSPNMRPSALELPGSRGLRRHFRRAQRKFLAPRASTRRPRQGHGLHPRHGARTRARPKSAGIRVAIVGDPKQSRACADKNAD